MNMNKIENDALQSRRIMENHRISLEILRKDSHFMKLSGVD